MNRLGVVVAGRRSHASPPEAWRCLRRELHAHDQLVWVDAPGARSGPWEGTQHVQAGATGRGRAYAVGVQAVTTEVVALTDEDTLVQPGWRDAALHAVGERTPAAGGPVDLPSSGPRRSVAGRLTDYASHAVPPYLSRSGDVSGNNVVYLRAVLDGAPELWKSEVDRALQDDGRPPVVAPGMRVRSARDYAWADLLAGRLAAGRLYGGRCTGSAGAGALATAVGCLALPPVRVARLLRTCRRDERLRRDLHRTLPEVVLAETWWSIGEALGRLRGDGGAARVW